MKPNECLHRANLLGAFSTEDLLQQSFFTAGVTQTELTSGSGVLMLTVCRALAGECGVPAADPCSLLCFGVEGAGAADQLISDGAARL